MDPVALKAASRFLLPQWRMPESQVDTAMLESAVDAWHSSARGTPGSSTAGSAWQTPRMPPAPWMPLSPLDDWSGGANGKRTQQPRARHGCSRVSGSGRGTSTGAAASLAPSISGYLLRSAFIRVLIPKQDPSTQEVATRLSMLQICCRLPSRKTPAAPCLHLHSGDPDYASETDQPNLPAAEFARWFRNLGCATWSTH